MRGATHPVILSEAKDLSPASLGAGAASALRLVGQRSFARAFGPSLRMTVFDRHFALHEPPPSTQKRAQCGWLSFTAPAASASRAPSSNCGS